MAGLPELDRDAASWLTDRVLETLARDEAVDAFALTWLLRRYATTDRADLADALGPALARALDLDVAAFPIAEAAAWLTLFVEASAISDDARLRTAAADLVAHLRAESPRAPEVEPLTLSVDACLRAAERLDSTTLVPQAIDELERVIGATYRPGGGLAHRVDEPDGVRGLLGDHVRAASALLTAYTYTGRLPYAMLAEELIQFARRTLWDDEAGAFDEQPRGGRGAGDSARPAVKPFALNCEATRVLGRLATLHESQEYRDAAVIAPDAEYGRDAGRTLASLDPAYREHGVHAAIYVIALDEWLALR